MAPSRVSDFRYDPTSDVYHCPGGKQLGTSGTVHEGKTLLYRASKSTAMVAHANRSAVQRIRRARSRATSMNTRETRASPADGQFTAAFRRNQLQRLAPTKTRRDNVFVERLWRSVKYEEVYLRAY